MRKRISAAAAALAAAMILAGCGDKPGEGGLRAEDNAQLENAAEMLDVPSDSLAANDEMLLGNGDEEDEGEAADNGAVGNEAVTNGFGNRE
jgi:hypothetical protein